MSLNTQSFSSNSAAKSNTLISDPRELDAVLLESIDEVLIQLLSDHVKQTIYQCLERQGLQRHQIPEYLPRFDAFLEENFGKSSRVIERQIAKRLYELLGWQLVEVPHYTLTDYVDMATRRSIMVRTHTKSANDLSKI